MPASFAAAGKPPDVPGQGLSLNLGDLDRFLETRLHNSSTNLYAEWQSLTEGYFLARILQYTGGNISQAARILGIDRGTLRTKLKALGVSLQDVLGSDDAGPAQGPTP